MSNIQSQLVFPPFLVPEPKTAEAEDDYFDDYMGVAIFTQYNGKRRQFNLSRIYVLNH